ncbi:DUF1080 domain-containing protein [Fulvivirgaceae bacterium BMA10]|uniref:DUF1080 domain-containing protein n=1 Tax=Splendidivirga corallicola TaxID=3051826 RepID=A0ABT8KVW6_9BACT|nr:DUF1080 domain-containing protein [Fulvivirgaceae bacterium BMA10]
MKQLITTLLLAAMISSCSTERKPESEAKVSPEAESDDWIVLFDGTSTQGWRAYNGDSLPPGWGIKDNTLTFSTEQILEEDYDYKGSRDIIYGAEEFENFELYVEWKIPEGGNSGIFYHLKEGYSGPPDVSPEYQLIDDENYAKIHDLTDYNMSLGYTENPAALQPLQQTASDYAMYAADPKEKVLNPAGSWNSTKIVFTPEKVEHWLNGKKVLSFVPWSEEWYEKKNSGKWEDRPDYGKFKTGYIGFQDHGSNLWFRNIKIKKL